MKHFLLKYLHFVRLVLFFSLPVCASPVMQATHMPSLVQRICVEQLLEPSGLSEDLLMTHVSRGLTDASLTNWYQSLAWLHQHKFETDFFNRLARGVARVEYSEPFTHRGLLSPIGFVGNLWQRRSPALRFSDKKARARGRARLLREALRENQLEMEAGAFKVVASILASEYPFLASNGLFFGGRNSAALYLSSLHGTGVYDTPQQRSRFQARPFRFKKEQTVTQRRFFFAIGMALGYLGSDFSFYWLQHKEGPEGDRTRLEMALKKFFRHEKIDKPWVQKLITELFVCYYLGPMRPKEPARHELYTQLLEFVRSHLLASLPGPPMQWSPEEKPDPVGSSKESRSRTRTTTRTTPQLLINLKRFVPDEKVRTSFYDWIRLHKAPEKVMELLIQTLNRRPNQWSDSRKTPVTNIYFLHTARGGIFVKWTKKDGLRDVLYWGNGNSIPQYELFIHSETPDNASDFPKLVPFLKELVTP